MAWSEQFIQLFSRIFRDIYAYSVTLTGAAIIQVPGALFKLKLQKLKKNENVSEKFPYIFSTKSFSYILGKWGSYCLGNGAFNPKLKKNN